MPSSRIYRTASLILPHNVVTVPEFDGVRWNDGFFSASTPTRFTIDTSGDYLVGASIGFNPSLSGSRYADLFLNGTKIVGEMTGGFAVNSNDGPTCSGSHIWRFSGGDYIELRLAQNSGSSLTTFCPASPANDARGTEFWIMAV